MVYKMMLFMYSFSHRVIHLRKERIHVLSYSVRSKAPVRPKERIQVLSYSCILSFLTCLILWLLVMFQYDYYKDFWKMAYLYYIV